MFEFCPKHNKRHIFAKPHKWIDRPEDPPGQSITYQEIVNHMNRKLKKPKGSAYSRNYVHESDYNRRNYDTSIPSATSIFSIDTSYSSDSSSDSSPSSDSGGWGGDGGSFSGGGSTGDF